jgi:hypothetical protein
MRIKTASQLPSHDNLTALVSDTTNRRRTKTLSGCALQEHTPIRITSPLPTLNPGEFTSLHRHRANLRLHHVIPHAHHLSPRALWRLRKPTHCLDFSIISLFLYPSTFCQTITQPPVADLVTCARACRARRDAESKATPLIASSTQQLQLTFAQPQPEPHNNHSTVTMSGENASGSPGGDRNEAPAGGAEHLNIKVTDNNNEVFFKIKRSTKLEKLMNAFCERQGKSMSSVRFLFEGQRVQPTDTPDTVSLLLPSLSSPNWLYSLLTWPLLLDLVSDEPLPSQISSCLLTSCRRLKQHH